jgi:hypothetical protein
MCFQIFAETESLPLESFQFLPDAEKHALDVACGEAAESANLQISA